MFNDDKDPGATPPGPGDAERITYDAVCTCDDTYGDNPWCPACYPDQATPGTGSQATPPNETNTSPDPAPDHE